MLDQPSAQLPVAQHTNPERSFAEEVRALRQGDGAGVAYVGGYQGAPVSHLVEVLIESQDAVTSARVAALADPEGDTLSKTLAAIATASPAPRHAAE